MRKNAIMLGAVALIAVSLYAGDPAGNSYVACEARFPSTKLAPGARTEILFTLTPADGIHVNADPAPAFTLDAPSIASLAGKPTITRDAKGYIAKGSPVRQPILVKRKVHTGTHTLKGTLVYFYCSDAEGWCMRQRQPVELTVTIGK